MSIVPRDGERPERSGTPSLRGELAFRLLVDAVEDYAIFLLGPDGRVMTWNRGAQRIKQYTAGEIIGQSFTQFYTPEDREAGRPASLLRRAAEFGRIEDEGWRVRKDGSRFWADVVLTALLDDHGVPYGYAKVTRDLTERRAAQTRERALHAEQQARLAAEAALSARDRFLSIASHELKTPVTSLQLSTEALVRAREVGKLDDTRLSATLARMTTATRRLSTLVNELLDITRLTAELLPFEPAPTDITALTRDVVERMADHYEPGRVTLIADPGISVRADASRVDQVIGNLLDNALKYSGDAPVTVEVATAEGGVLVSVRDQGIGLDVPGDRLFEAFGRGENAEHIQGMGLGLFIARQIVERHGGRISGSTRAGGGSTFTVWLPSDPPGDARAPT